MSSYVTDRNRGVRISAYIEERQRFHSLRTLYERERERELWRKSTQDRGKTRPAKSKIGKTVDAGQRHHVERDDAQ